MAFENLETTSKDWVNYTPTTDQIAQVRSGSPELTSNNLNEQGVLLDQFSLSSVVLKSGVTYYYRSSDGIPAILAILEQ